MRKLQTNWQGSKRLVVVGAALLAFTASAACGDSSESTPTTAPEDVRASAAAVAAGLKSIDATASSIATTAASDKKRAKELVEQIEPLWMKIEGTVKANDPDAYVAFEDNFSGLEKAAESGDATKAQSAAGAIAKAVAAYLAKFPG